MMKTEKDQLEALNAEFNKLGVEVRCRGLSAALADLPEVMYLDQSSASLRLKQARKERQRQRELDRRTKRLAKINKG